MTQRTLIFLNFCPACCSAPGKDAGIPPMYAFPVTDLALRLDALLELADIDEVILTREGADNLVLVREPVWRGVQEALHLLGNDLNAERLLCSLLQLRAELLPLNNPT